MLGSTDYSLQIAVIEFLPQTGNSDKNYLTSNLFNVRWKKWGMYKILIVSENALCKLAWSVTGIECFYLRYGMQ